MNNEISQIDLKDEMQNVVLEEMDLSRDSSDDEIFKTIDRVLIEKGKDRYISLKDKREMRKEIFNSIRKLDVLQDLIDDPQITEIMVNGANKIFVEKNGTIYPKELRFSSEAKLENIIQQMVSGSNRIINEANPIVDARLWDGSRINIVLPPVAIDGAMVTIRKFPNKPITMEQLLEYESISEEAASLLKQLVVAGYNIFISGGTGSGKTTFLNVLSNYIPSHERIITIEDSAELQIRNVPNLVRMEVRKANTEGLNEITIRDLIKTALRQRPDRIIVGEIRDGAAFDMLQAFNTGHDGSLSTGHANSPKDMLSRLESLVLMGADIPLISIQKQIASAIDIIVHLGRLRDRSRRVLEITEIVAFENGDIKLNPIYCFEEEGEADGRVIGGLQKLNELLHRDKLTRAGLGGCIDR